MSWGRTSKRNSCKRNLKTFWKNWRFIKLNWIVEIKFRKNKSRKWRIKEINTFDFIKLIIRVRTYKENRIS